MSRFLFRVDDGPGIGAGHLMRCLALAEAVHECGGTVRLCSARQSPLHARWQGLGAQIHVREREAGSADDLAQTLQQIREFDADWLVIDGYRFDTPWLDAAAGACRVLCLDDLGDRDAAVQLMLNHNPGAEQRYGGSYGRCGRALLGLDWFLLRREWRDARQATVARRLVLTLGGEDPGDRMLALMQALLGDGRAFMADVVCSASEAGFQRALEMAELRPDRFTVHRAPVALPTLVRRAALAICGGGVTPVEAASLGVPSIIIVLADNQRPGAEYLGTAGAARVQAFCEGAMVNAARSALDLLDEDMTRSAMKVRGRALIDGAGPARVLAAMMEKSE